MTSDQDPSLESMRAIAAQAGLPLTDEELERLKPGVRRNRAYAQTVRSLLEPTSEPAGTFDASRASGPKE